MRLKHLLISLIILLMSVNLVSAKTIYSEHFDVKYDVVQDKIALGEEAEFSFKVTNKNPKIERFRLQNTATDFDLRTSPLSVKLSGQKITSKTDGEPFSVFLLPHDDVKLGQHEVLLNAKFESGDNKQFPLLIYVQPISSQRDKYATSVGVDAVFNDKFDPRNEFVMNINLDNLNRKSIDNVTVKVESKVLNEVIQTSLKPLEKGKVVAIKKSFDPRLKPQSDTIIITVVVNQEIIKSFTKSLEIIDYTGDLTENIEVKRGILSTKYLLTYLNDGNTVKSQTISYPIKGMAKYFTSSSPKANVVKTPDGDTFLSWELALNPGEGFNVVVKTSIQTPVVLLILVLGLLGYYYYHKSPVVVTKRALKLGKTKGDITEIKVNIDLRNPSSQTIDKVTISDRVPSIAYVVNEFRVGTLQPTKILRHESKGDSIIKWELDQLDPREDRILTYKIKTKLGIIGDITLPQVTVKYRKGDKVVTVKSNPYSVEA